MRQTTAALWLSLGLGLEYVRRQMGHRSIDTTIRSYGHLGRSLIPDAAARVEAAAFLLRPAEGLVTPDLAGTTAVPRA